MKDNFFLRCTHHDGRFMSFGAIFVFVIIFFCELFYKEFNVGLIYIILFFICTAIYDVIRYKISGIYINGADITYKKVFSKRKIDINSVICIRVAPDYGPKGLFDVDGALRDKNGNVLLCMGFFSRCYEDDEMDGYEIIEAIKALFIEKQLCRCIYDKEALDYILTLNPNIKVDYYDQK